MDFAVNERSARQKTKKWRINYSAAPIDVGMPLQPEGSEEEAGDVDTDEGAKWKKKSDAQDRRFFIRGISSHYWIFKRNGRSSWLLREFDDEEEEQRLSLIFFME